MYVMIGFSSDSSLKQQNVDAVNCDCKIIYHKWSKPSPTCLTELMCHDGVL